MILGYLYFIIASTTRARGIYNSGWYIATKNGFNHIYSRKNEKTLGRPTRKNSGLKYPALLKWKTKAVFQINWTYVVFLFLKRDLFNCGISNVGQIGYHILAHITRRLKCFLEFQMRVKTEGGLIRRVNFTLYLLRVNWTKTSLKCGLNWRAG